MKLYELEENKVYVLEEIKYKVERGSLKSLNISTNLWEESKKKC